MLDTIGKNLDSSGVPVLREPDKKCLETPQLYELQRFGSRVTKFGVNFAVCNTDGELVLLYEGAKGVADSNRDPVLQKTQNGNPDLATIRQKAYAKRYTLYAKRCIGTELDVCRFGEENPVLATVLKSGSGTPEFVALIDLENNSCFANIESSLAQSTNIEGDTKHAQSLREPDKMRLETQMGDTLFSEMLLLLGWNFQVAAKAEEQIEMVSTELAQTYEELVLLHKLSANMKVTEPNASFLQMACDNLTDIVSVEGIAVLLEKTIEDEKRLVLAAGSGLIDIDEQMAAVLHSRLAEEIAGGREALLDSEVDSPFRYEWSGSIKNIIVVPLCGKDKAGPNFPESAQNGNSIIGLMVAINRIDKPDFDSTDLKLFNSVANSCAVFIENGRLFKDLKELFIGSLKALTSSIDAKDQYTRGHSERVAFISRWIAERLAEQGLLKEEQIHKIYLAGLLHDIGKVGIDETVLRKEGKLTEQELSHIRTHPSIGAGILSGIKQMRDIVPGVLSHHERVDGKGYPSGLVGEKITLVGKIIGLADSFDAMTSKRTYRDALTVEQALAEIEKELGTQFDEQVARAFINSDVYQLWDIMQDGFSEIYGSGNFSEYGTAAVGSIIR